MTINTTMSGVASPTLTTATAASPKATKLHDAAQQFEALMINEMLKSVRESSSSGWLGSEQDGEAGQASAMEMAESQFSTALAKSGGLGLSKMIESSIAK